MINKADAPAVAAPGPPSEEAIGRLVDGFYARVREDGLLGPVFAARIGNWEPHLARMRDFWSGILHASGRYRGNPVQAHAALPGPADAHFRRWLELFEATARDTLSPEAAADLLARARRMSRVLQRHHPDGIREETAPAPEAPRFSAATPPTP